MYDFKNIKWKKSYFTATVQYIFIDHKNCKIFKKYKYNIDVKNLKNIDNKINKFDFVPRMEFFEEENIIVEEYFKNNLTISNKPFDYFYQLLNIYKTLGKNKLYHNDIKPQHWFVSNGKIKLIDWDKLSVGKPRDRWWVNNYILLLIFYYSLDYIVMFILLIILMVVYFKFYHYKKKLKF